MPGEVFRLFVFTLAICVYYQLFVDRDILHKHMATEQALNKWMALLRSVQKRDILDVPHQ